MFGGHRATRRAVAASSFGPNPERKVLGVEGKAHRMQSPRDSKSEALGWCHRFQGNTNSMAGGGTTHSR